MDDIKSAREIAMEKVEELGEPTDEERLRWKYIPEGERLAVKYIKESCNLIAEMSQYQENVRACIVEGAQDILIRNVNLPRDEPAKKLNRQVMDGLKALKNDKVSVENVYSKIRHIFNHFTEQGEQQKKQAYEALKAEFEAKVQDAIRQQLGGSAGIRIDVERQPQFQEEWRKTQTQIDAQYTVLLDEYKQELRAIA